jgi:hypothetical protein
MSYSRQYAIEFSVSLSSSLPHRTRPAHSSSISYGLLTTRKSPCSNNSYKDFGKLRSAEKADIFDMETNLDTQYDLVSSIKQPRTMIDCAFPVRGDASKARILVYANAIGECAGLLACYFGRR